MGRRHVHVVDRHVTRRPAADEGGAGVEGERQRARRDAQCAGGDVGLYAAATAGLFVRVGEAEAERANANDVAVLQLGFLHLLAIDQHV